MYNNSSVTGSICFLHNKTTWVLLLKASTNNFPLLLILVASLNKKTMMVKKSKLCFSANKLFLTNMPFQKKITLQVLKEFFKKKKKKKKTRGEKRPPVWASASWLVQPLSYPRSSAVPWQDKHNNQDRGVSWRAQRSSGNNSLIVPLRYSDSRHTQVWAHTSGFREQAAED